MRRIDIAMTPAEALAVPPADCYVVIDVLRATTTMAVLFDRGLESLLVVDEVDAARAAATAVDVLLFGEREGLRPEGFDYGNSPVEAGALQLAGRRAIHVTSNGTRALCAVAGRGNTVAGALVNLSAVARFAAQFEDVLVVCAGNGGGAKVSLEDFAAAATLVHALFAAHPGAVVGDGARLARALEQPERLVERSEHAELLRRLGFDSDIVFAAQRDLAPAVPVVREFGAGWCRLERA